LLLGDAGGEDVQGCWAVGGEYAGTSAGQLSRARVGHARAASNTSSLVGVRGAAMHAFLLLQPGFNPFVQQQLFRPPALTWLCSPAVPRRPSNAGA
jgi:hypothetical protein